MAGSVRLTAEIGDIGNKDSGDHARAKAFNTNRNHQN
ncbi:MAG: hypothetical protein K0R52_1196, partial [Alphaproteobacteria bacterium]|nr:hypothetical protein [Alphaproteobacteria bacterium]